MINSKLEKAAYADNLTIKIDKSVLIEDLKTLAGMTQDSFTNGDALSSFLETISHYKFHECLTENVMELMVQNRFFMTVHLKNVLRMPIDFVDERG